MRQNSSLSPNAQRAASNKDDAETEGITFVRIKVEPEKRDEPYDERFPVHSACYERASFEAIKDLINRLDKLSAVSERDEEGHYPLHIACAKKASYDVIKLLVEIYPGAVKTPLNDGTLPIMCNVTTPHQSSKQVIRLLLKYHPEAQDECIHLSKTYNDGSMYEGFFDIFGKRSKKGRLTYVDGKSWYEGEWKDDRFEGWGQYMFPNESEYQGNFKCGKFHGFGNLKIKQPNFYGKMTLIRHYEGNFRDGKKHGMGICKYLGGDVYEG